MFQCLDACGEPIAATECEGDLLRDDLDEMTPCDVSGCRLDELSTATELICCVCGASEDSDFEYPDDDPGYDGAHSPEDEVDDDRDREDRYTWCRHCGHIYDQFGCDPDCGQDALLTLS